MRVGPFADEQLREQCVGASSGARIWWDAAEDAVHWPLLVLYPEVGMSDFVQASQPPAAAPPSHTHPRTKIAPTLRRT